MPRLAPLLLACLAVLPFPAAADAARPMRLGFVDVNFERTDPRPLAADAARDGAALVRIYLRWRNVAPTRPARPGDPRDPAYDWTATDVQVRAAAEQGLDVLLVLDQAPDWAEGPRREPGAPTASWRPQPEALRAFAAAAARHYGGGTPSAPRVRSFQVWNEPNLEDFLSPQYAGGRQASASHYRRMLRAAYGGLKAVDPGIRVVTAGTAPFGDPPGGRRTPPAVFWRALLCLDGPQLRRLPCPRPARFDVWAHHPYNGGGPGQAAADPDNASVPDLPRLRRIVRRAARTGRALPRRAKPLWVTEVAWESRPPDPRGVPAARHARWLSAALRGAWRAGARTVVWFGIRDQLPEPSYASTFQSGVRSADGSEKLAARAYRFPLAAGPPRRGRATVWGMAPARGRVLVQRRGQGRWRTVARPRAGAGRVFAARIRARRGSRVRARAGGATSLSWRVGLDG